MPTRQNLDTIWLMRSSNLTSRPQQIFVTTMEISSWAHPSGSSLSSKKQSRGRGGSFARRSKITVAMQRRETSVTQVVDPNGARQIRSKRSSYLKLQILLQKLRYHLGAKNQSKKFRYSSDFRRERVPKSTELDQIIAFRKHKP